MTEWSLSDEDQLDFLDPNDPTGSPTDAAPTAGGVPTSSADEVDPADLSGAVSDSTGSVHVWVDDDRRLLHVRVSNRWRERLRETPLDHALMTVLRRAQSRVLPAPDVPQAAEDVVAMTRTEASLDYLLERSLDIRNRRAKLAAKPADQVRRRRVVGQRVVGQSSSRQVAVTLNVYGNTSAVSCEPDWLKSVKTADLGAAILEAHEQAYAQWSPPTVLPGEYDELAQEGEIIALEAAAMLRRGA